MSRDPIRERGGANLHAFAANSPVNHGDPFGLNVLSLNRFPLEEAILFFWGQAGVGVVAGDWSPTGPDCDCWVEYNTACTCDTGVKCRCTWTYEGAGARLDEYTWSRRDATDQELGFWGKVNGTIMDHEREHLRDAEARASELNRTFTATGSGCDEERSRTAALDSFGFQKAAIERRYDAKRKALEAKWGDAKRALCADVNAFFGRGVIECEGFQ